MATPSLDPQRLLELHEALGDGTVLAGLLARFLRETPGHLKALSDAVRHGDLKAAAAQAHFLKGGAAMLGARRFVALCADLEQLARSGSSAGAAEGCVRLRAEFETAGRLLEQERARLSAPAS